MIAPDWMFEQVWQLAIATACGLVLGFFYDCYQGCLARTRRRSRESYLLLDLLFGLFAIVLTLILWFGLTDGSLRLSVIFWMSGGGLLYAWLLSPFLRIRKHIAGRVSKRREQPGFQRRIRRRRAWNVALARRTLRGWHGLRQRFSRKPTAMDEEENKEI